MKKHMQVALVAIGLTFATAACERGRRESERTTQETQTTGAKVQAQAEETAKMKAARAEDRTKLEKDFDAAERKATYLKQKATHATGATKKNADAAISEFDARRNTAKASLNKLNDETSPAWDANKKAAQDDVAAVDKAVEALDNTLGKK